MVQGALEDDKLSTNYILDEQIVVLVLRAARDGREALRAV